MWQYSKKDISPEVSLYTISRNGTEISYSVFIELLCTSGEFRIFFNELLKSSPFAAFFWETRPLTVNNAGGKFEFVLVNSVALSVISADRSSFAQYFNGEKYAVAFLNLSGDAKLVVPVEVSAADNYSHIASFVRKASPEQLDAFWQKTGEEIGKSLSDEPKWVSTSGLGVHWLHVRIDSRPKYYNYLPYRNTR